jgi:hypothetical protein
MMSKPLNPKCQLFSTTPLYPIKPITCLPVQATALHRNENVREGFAHGTSLSSMRMLERDSPIEHKVSRSRHEEALGKQQGPSD